MYKNIIKSTILILIVFNFLGCGGRGGSSSTSSTSEIIGEKVKEGSKVEIQPGDEIRPLSKDTYIEVKHIINTKNKIVTVKRGSIDFISGDFVTN